MCGENIMQGNLLTHPWIGGFLRSRWFPGLFQWPTLVIFVVIVAQLMLGPISAHDNLGIALTWVLWWPLIPILFLFLGRFWCAVCPFATLNDLAQKFVGNHRPVPRFLKKYGIWIIDAVFILITWSDHVVGIVHSPRGSGILLLLLTTGVVFSGVFWERRAWCRYLCFLGGLSGNYARTGILALRGTPALCAKCVTPVCYKGGAAAPGCPLFEFPKTLASNANCNLCGYCVKNCPYNSLRLTLRLPTQELWFIRVPKLAEAFLAVVIMGIVFVQNITMLEVWSSILVWLETLVRTQSYFVTFTLTFIISMAIPVGLVALAAAWAQRVNGESLAQNFARFGYALIALDVAGHIAHNLFHLLAEGKAVVFTVQDLFFGPRWNSASLALVDLDVIRWLQYLLIALGFVASLYTAYRIAQHNYSAAKTWATFFPFAALITILAAINFWLFMLPMAARM